MARDKSQIKFEEYNFKLGGTDIGYTKMDTTQVMLGMTYRQVADSAQYTGVIARSKSGAAPTLQVEILQTKFSHIFNTIAGDQLYPIADGSKVAWGLGSRKLDLFDEAQEGILHPVGVDDDDYANDIMFWNCVADLSNATFKGMRDGAMSIVIPFTILPNEDAGPDMDLGIFGDHTAVEADPYGIIITTERLSRAPHKHIPALTLNSSSTAKVYAHGFYKTDSTVTAAINEAGNVTATDASFDFDALSTASNFAVGDYIMCGTEVMQITAITYATSTTGTITVSRGLCGKAAASHLDNATLTKLSNVYILPISRRVTWASSSTADVTVGDSNSLNTKGLLTWVSDGSSNITAVKGSTTSQTLVVTTTT